MLVRGRAWLEDNITDAVNPTINAKMSSYWTQIANTFKNYDSKLVFAGANEPAVTTAAQMTTLTTYDQTSINAVRARILECVGKLFEFPVRHANCAADLTPTHDCAFHFAHDFLRASR